MSDRVKLIAKLPEMTNKQLMAELRSFCNSTHPQDHFIADYIRSIFLEKDDKGEYKRGPEALDIVASYEKVCPRAIARLNLYGSGTFTLSDRGSISTNKSVISKETGFFFDSLEHLSKGLLAMVQSKYSDNCYTIKYQNQLRLLLFYWGTNEQVKKYMPSKYWRDCDIALTDDLTQMVYTRFISSDGRSSNLFRATEASAIASHHDTDNPVEHRERHAAYNNIAKETKGKFPYVKVHEYEVL